MRACICIHTPAHTPTHVRTNEVISDICYALMHMHAHSCIIPHFFTYVCMQYEAMYAQLMIFHTNVYAMLAYTCPHLLIQACLCLHMSGHACAYICTR